MKLKTSIVLITTAGLFGCAATVPTELAKARESYRHASAGPAAQLAPADLHKAEEALAQAEKSFKSDPDSYRTRDLAYAADRKASLAEARAAIASQRGTSVQASKDFQTTQEDIMKDTKEKLSKSRTDLAASERNNEVAADKLSTERQNRSDSEKKANDMQIASANELSQTRIDSDKKAADALIASRDELSKEQVSRMDSERRAADAQNLSADKLSAEQKSRLDSEGRATEKEAASAKELSTEQAARKEADKRAGDAQIALANLAAVKEESRGMVITLSGSVLFASNDAKLLPSAQSRLNQVADALLDAKGRKLDVEGHTDSKGTAAYNAQLSQRRAEAVRTYLISRGYPAEKIQAHGIGKDRPVADNGSPEGRANNRRVEIIVER